MVGGLLGQRLKSASECGQRAAVDRVVDRLAQPDIAEQRPVGVQHEEVELRTRIDEVLLPAAGGRWLPGP